MINLDQAFYGRDSIKGYRLLASSNPTHNSIVERLCASIGTPDGSSVLEPFYINHIENGFRYMIYCGPGAPDDDGRKTLFFHAFIGSHRDLLNSEFGIGNLIQNNAFVTSYKTGSVLPSSFREDASSLPWGKTTIVWERNNLAIQSSKPELPIITGILKSEIDKFSWASFTFRPLDFCQLYIISQFIPVPQNRKCVNTSGETLNLRTKTMSTDSHSTPTLKTSMQKRRTFLVPFCISLFVNVILALFIVFAGNTKNTHPIVTYDEGQENHKEEPPTQLKTNGAATKTFTREDVLQELRTEFEKKYTRQSYKDWKKSLQENSKSLKKADELNDIPLLRAGDYIKFVNQTLFDEKGDI